LKRVLAVFEKVVGDDERLRSAAHLGERLASTPGVFPREKWPSLTGRRHLRIGAILSQGYGNPSPRNERAIGT
jgi:hypothetical protein